MWNLEFVINRDALRRRHAFQIPHSKFLIHEPVLPKVGGERVCHHGLSGLVEM
jgi:hypothetical protein